MDNKQVNRIHIGGTLKEILKVTPENKTLILLEVNDKISEGKGRQLNQYPFTFQIKVWLDEKLSKKIKECTVGSQLVTVSGKLISDNTIIAYYINPFTAKSYEPFFPSMKEITERELIEQQQEKKQEEE